MVDVKDLKQEDFSAHANEKFKIQPGSGKAIEAELVEIKGRGSKGEEAGREPFSLLFRCPKETNVEQQVCKVKHSKMGEMELFLVPLGPDDEGALYEAVFT